MKPAGSSQPLPRESPHKLCLLPWGPRPSPQVWVLSRYIGTLFIAPDAAGGAFSPTDLLMEARNTLPQPGKPAVTGCVVQKL